MNSNSENLKKDLLRISKTISEAQKDIAILDALSWRKEATEAFRKSNYETLPENPYKPISFDPTKKLKEFDAILQDIDSTLGNKPVAKILKRVVESWKDAVGIIQYRGTAKVYNICKKVYGHTKQVFPGTNVTVAELAHALDKIIKIDSDDKESVTPKELRDALESRLKTFFDKEDMPQIEIVNGIDSDAAAGDGFIIVRDNAKFIDKDIDVLEVHEGWVHVGSILNGKKQPYAKWLSSITPRTELLQEGLAAFVELITMSSYPGRLRKIVNRVLAIELAENGKSFKDVVEWFKARGIEEKTAVLHTERIFKGGTTGAPFTRDIIYLKGMVLVMMFIKKVIQENKPYLINHLFNGHVNFNDIPILVQLEKDGVVIPPKYIPKMLKNNAENLVLAIDSVDLFKRTKLV